jgi:hypothetical protein
MPKPTEHSEQAAFIQYCERNLSHLPELAWLYATPNGGKRNLQVAIKLKAEGVKAGVPDLCLPVPRQKPSGGVYHGLYMETKVKPNKPTPEQRAWLAFLEAQGYAAAVCYGYDGLVETVIWYLALPPMAHV